MAIQTRTPPMLTAQEIGERARAIYENALRAQVETPENTGRFLTIDIRSGAYGIGDDYLETLQAFRQSNPDSVTCTLRIGHASTFRHRSPRS